MNKKVLFLINGLARGGAERVFVNQINELNRQGILVYLGLLFPLSESSYAGELEIPAEHVIYFNGGTPFSLFLKLEGVIREHDIDIIYSTLELPNILARLSKILHPRLRVVTREGSAVTDKKGRTSPKPWKFRFIDIILNLFVHRVIAVSDEIGGILRSYQPHVRHKIIVLENGVTITEDRPDLERRLALKNNDMLNIITAASMNYYERAFEYLIEAISLLPVELRTRTRLFFAGDGTLRSMYEKQTKELDLEENITFLGRVDTVTLSAEYKKADVFVLCSTSEGSPNVILEAAAHGLPVVTTRVGSAVTMVVEGETGWFIPFKNAQAIADKLEWLAGHEAEAKRMGLAAYDHVSSNFSFARKVEELRSLLFS